MIEKKQIEYDMKKLRFLSILVFFLVYIFSSFGQKDTSLNVNKGNVLGYKMIESRYEGFYIAKVNASFRLVNFSYGDFYFEPVKDEVIYLELPASIKEQIRVRAVGVPNDLFYQMDAYLLKDYLLKWPVKDVLLRDSRTKTSRNLGFFGFQGEGLNTTYLPIAYHTSTYKPTATPLVLKFVAPTGLSDVQWKIDGEMDDFKMLTQKKYYAGQSITVKLPIDLASGEYTFWIKGKKKHDTEPSPPERFKLKL